MPQLTIIDLGKKVKAKYPGQYDDLSDMELGQRVKAKYPDAYGDFMDVGIPKGLPGPPIPPAVKEILGGPPEQHSQLPLQVLSAAKKFMDVAVNTEPGARDVTPVDSLSGLLFSGALPTGQNYAGMAAGLKNSPAAQALSAVAQKLGVPNAARAAQNFQSIESAVGAKPININAANKAAADAFGEFSTGGGSLPDVVRKYLKDVSFRYDPLTGELLNPMDYSTGRKFLSNAGRKLSADEVQKLTPVMARRLAQFRDALATSVRQPAADAGLGSLYDQAIVEYRRAKTMQDAQEILGKWLKRALVTGAALETGYEIYSHTRKR